MAGLKKFKKGDPRINRKGRPPQLPNLTEVLAKLLGEESRGTTATEKIIAALRKKAYYGDNRAAELLLDRAFGKVQQQIDLTSKNNELKAPAFNIFNGAPDLADDEKKVDGKKSKK